ncbi:hypothetical protein EI94DRAFT_1821722 [Lactarius quietus]|nr:hypothetical protein EI94DRAFT_1821722 [Lactarius quietus]
MSIYAEKWSGDVSADADYSETDSKKDSDAENLSGSSDEWEGDSESEMGSEENEDADTGSEEGQDSGLTEDQLDMLQKHVSEFRAANLPCQLTIVKDCVTNIQSGWQSEATFNRMKVQMLVCRYLYNKGRRSKKKSTLNLGQKWTYRDIVMDIHRKELHIMALSMSNSAAGSAEYLGCYQKAVKTIFGGFTEEEITNFDINDQLGAPSFKSCHEDWTSEPMFQDFSKWAGKCFGQQPNDSDEEVPNRRKDAPLEIKLKTDTQGYPMLPSWESIKDAKLKYKKYLIGRYLTEMHQMASGGGKGRIPWTRLRQAQGDYVLQEHLPAGVTLTQYHHIQLGDANALLQHWTTRQATGLIPFRFKKVANTAQQSEPALRCREVPRNISHGNRENDPDGIQAAQEQGSEHDHNFQGDGEDSDGNDAQGGGNAADNLGPSTHSLPHNCLTPGHSGCSSCNSGAKECVELPTEDGTDLAPPLVNQPYSLNNGSQLDIAAEEQSPKSVMRRPRSDKFNFLASLSKDRKYHELLHEINQMLSSDLSSLYYPPAIHHPVWAHWTWTKVWLSEAFHSGGEKPVWQWLQSCPYARDLLQEGESGDVSVDGIALAIRSLLRDIEAMQFPDKFHPPQHVAHSTVRFAVIGTIIHPALDDFIQIMRDRNQNIAANDGQMLLAAPVSNNQEPQCKWTCKGQGRDDQDATDTIHLHNRQKLNPQASDVFPQTWCSGRTTRPTEWAKAMHSTESNAVATINTKDGWDFVPYRIDSRERDAPTRYLIGRVRWRHIPDTRRRSNENNTGYYAEAATAQRYHPVVFNRERCCWVELRWSNTNNYFKATRPAADDLHINIPLTDARPIDQQGPIDGQQDDTLDSEPPRTEFQLRSVTPAVSSHTSERSPTPRSETVEPEEIAVQSPEVDALATRTAELHIPEPIRGIPYSYMTTQTEVSPPRLVINEQTGHVQQLQPEDMEAANRAMGPDVPDAPRYHHPKTGHSHLCDHGIMDHQVEEEDHQVEEEDRQAEEEDHL